jgi:hypothetical protein
VFNIVAIVAPNDKIGVAGVSNMVRRHFPAYRFTQSATVMRERGAWHWLIAAWQISRNQVKLVHQLAVLLTEGVANELAVLPVVETAQARLGVRFPPSGIIDGASGKVGITPELIRSCMMNECSVYVIKREE